MVAMLGAFASPIEPGSRGEASTIRCDVAIELIGGCTRGWGGDCDVVGCWGRCACDGGVAAWIVDRGDHAEV
jgi:hypothetical protein